MWPFSKRQARTASAPGSEHPAQRLLADFDVIGSQAQEQTSRQLALLWMGFIEEFGGPRPFAEAPPGQQEAYLGRLDRIIERSRPRKDAELASFHYSAAMLRLFLEAL